MSNPGAHVDVSVIIPTYNRLWCLPLAVQSCRGTACRTEIVVVDDGSTDGTWQWLQSQTDVLALRQSNQGKDWAVARGLAYARGRYVKFLDSDDQILPGAIDRQLTAAEQTDADIIAAGMKFVTASGTVLLESEYAPTDDFIAQQLGEGDDSHYSAFLFRRELVSEIPHRQEFGALDDRMFMIEVALRGPRVESVTGQTLLHVHHGAERLQFAVGIREVVTHFCHLSVYRRAMAELRDRGELTSRRAAAAARVLWPLAHCIARTHPVEGAEVEAWIRRLCPQFEPPEGGILGLCFRRLGFSRTQRLLRVRRALVRRHRVPASNLLSLPQ
jgi:hypothetical protein